MLLIIVAVPGVVAAQIRASEQGVTKQTIDGTTITIDYSRPGVRDRDPLFGGVVHWGEVWTPGANWATTLETDKAITLNGHRVPMGKYSMWIVVREDDQWTMVLDTTVRLFHLSHPDSAAHQIRFPVEPGEGPFTEMLTWDFPEVSATGATMALHWGTTTVPLAVTVESSLAITLPEEDAQPYLGSYTFTWSSNGNESSFDVTYEEGKLWAHLDPAPFPSIEHMILIEIADDWFTAGQTVDGKLYDVTVDLVFEFNLEEGAVTGFGLRGPGDVLMATGTRN
jgi:hypothetical protein